MYATPWPRFIDYKHFTTFVISVLGSQAHTLSHAVCGYVCIYIFVCVCIHKYEGQTLGDGEGQGGMVCCCPWGRKESDMTERLNNTIQYTYTHTDAHVCVCVYKHTFFPWTMSINYWIYTPWPLTIHLTPTWVTVYLVRLEMFSCITTVQWQIIVYFSNIICR